MYFFQSKKFAFGASEGISLKAMRSSSCFFGAFRV